MSISEKLIAFYLPQFHPIPENDQWWGKGFTEWTNVTRACPVFEGHYQPKLPSDLGFYDLRLPEVHDEQARLAKLYGIHGFCFYYYNFNGKRLLEKPLEIFLERKKPDMPFCICWANENWTRRWDGSEQEILMAQEHSPENDIKIIHDIIPMLQDPRYIRIKDAPFFMVYRIHLLPDPEATIYRWREACARAGIKKIHVAAVQSFGIEDPRPYGCDSAVEFPPHNISANDITGSMPGLNRDFTGKVYDYNDMATRSMSRPKPDYRLFRGIMTAWDNTARNKNGSIYFTKTTRDYEIWLKQVIEYTRQEPDPDYRLIFINAWNEWAEGTYLEPDRVNGYRYLEATRQALADSNDWKCLIARLADDKDMPRDEKNQIADRLGKMIESRDRSIQFLSTVYETGLALCRREKRVVFHPHPPSQNAFAAVYGVNNLFQLSNGKYAKLAFLQIFHEPDLNRRKPFQEESGGIFQIDLLDSTRGLLPGICLSTFRSVYVAGYFFIDDVSITRESILYLTLKNLHHPTQYYAAIPERIERQDVVNIFDEIPETSTRFCGFEGYLSFQHVEPGEYILGGGQIRKDRIVYHFMDEPIVILSKSPER